MEFACHLLPMVFLQVTMNVLEGRLEVYAYVVQFVSHELSWIIQDALYLRLYIWLDTLFRQLLKLCRTELRLRRGKSIQAEWKQSSTWPPTICLFTFSFHYVLHRRLLCDWKFASRDLSRFYTPWVAVKYILDKAVLLAHVQIVQIELRVQIWAVVILKCDRPTVSTSDRLRREQVGEFLLHISPTHLGQSLATYYWLPLLFIL